MRSTARISSHPIHPMLVAFPIGLWIASWVFDILGSVRGSTYLWAASFYCAIFGIVGALAAAVAGAIDCLRIVGEKSGAQRRGAIHVSLTVLILVGCLVSGFRRGGATTPVDGRELSISASAIVALGF